MDSCVNCNSQFENNQQRYHILDLDIQLIAIVEPLIGRGANEDDKLCQNCFNTILEQLDRPNRRPNFQRCLCCNRSLLTRHSHPLTPGPITTEIAARISPREISPGDRVCYRCWHRARTHVRRQQQDIPVEHIPVEQEPDPQNGAVPAEILNIIQPQNNGLVRLPNFRCAGRSESHCFVQGCRNTERLRIPQYLRKKLLIEHRFYTHRNTRVCRQHLMAYDWNILYENIYVNQFEVTEIEDMVELASKPADVLLTSMFEDFDNLDDSVCHYWTGLSKNDFLDLLDETPRLRTLKSPKTALAVYLVKLRSGEPNERMGVLFGISEKKVRILLNKVRAILMREFVPQHLGLQHITRDELLRRNLLIPEGLFGENNTKVIVICDGTYIYLQKSSNYLFQRRSYSLHKYRNLVKPFMMVSSDGHIIDIFGPYAATDSDADIMNDLFQNEDSEVRNYFRRGDVFILDRGFRDAIPLLTNLGYDIYKPESLQRGERQLSTINANKSRCVTMCRWVVEVVNGRFKRDFKLLRNTYFNAAATHLFDDFKIAGALINRFHIPLLDRVDADLILNRAVQRLEMPNILANFILANPSINRQNLEFIRIDADIPALNVFPVMTMSDLELLGLGIYQIKQAKSYYGEHLRENGTFVVEVYNQVELISMSEASHDTVLIRGRIRSRHRRSKKYLTYILLDLHFDFGKKG